MPTADSARLSWAFDSSTERRLSALVNTDLAKVNLVADSNAVRFGSAP